MPLGWSASWAVAKKQGQPYLTPPGVLSGLPNCNCSCLDLRRAVLEKSEAVSRAEYEEARGKILRVTPIT